MAAGPNPLVVSSPLEAANPEAAESPEADLAIALERADHQARERCRAAVDPQALVEPPGPDRARVELRAVALDPGVARSRVGAAGAGPDCGEAHCPRNNLLRIPHR